jgi:CheY-like chemotaxis protein
MPLMDGWQVLAQIRRESDVPVIMLTALTLMLIKYRRCEPAQMITSLSPSTLQKWLPEYTLFCVVCHITILIKTSSHAVPET